MRERAGGSPGALGVRLRLPRPRCPPPWAQRPPHGDAGPLSLRLDSVRSSAGGGGGDGGALWSPAAAPRRPRGGGLAARAPGGQPLAGGAHSSPAPLNPVRAGPSCRPSLGPPAPPAVVARPGSLGAGVRVSGRQLVGCGAVGSPPRSLSLPPLPREVARASPLRCIVGGAWVGGLGSAGVGVPRHCPPPPLSRARRLGRHLRRRLSGGWGGGGGGFCRQ